MAYSLRSACSMRISLAVMASTDDVGECFFWVIFFILEK
jgi:hypothetical protein